MRSLLSLLGCSALSLLFTTETASAQIPMTLPLVHFTNNVQASPHLQTIRLSAGAQEMASELALMPMLERLDRIPEKDRCGASTTLETLLIRQEISDRVLSASLQVDGLFAEIDNEVGRIDAVRDELEDRRDRALRISNLAGIVTSGIGGVVGTALQFKDSTMQAGNVVGVAAGAFSTFLSVIGIRQQHGGRQTLEGSTNMLARLFNGHPKEHSEYPEEVWNYLNAKPPTEEGPETRIERLKADWLKSGRLDSDPAKRSRKIILLTDNSAAPQKLSINLLNDRAGMLADVRMRVSFMKRDLSKLLLAVRCH